MATFANFFSNGSSNSSSPKAKKASEKFSSSNLLLRLSSQVVPRRPSTHDLSEEKLVFYVEQVRGHYYRHKMDFNSPRTLEAAAQLGITYEDCIKKYLFFLN